MTPDKTGYVTREIDPTVLQELSGVLSTSFIADFVELNANAYDADAGQVTNTISFRDDLAIIKDDGDGMLPEEVQHFYRTGGSIKKAIKLTSKGRVPLGNHGLQTLVLKNLAQGVTLDTLKDGWRTVVHEDTINLDPEYRIQSNSYRVKGKGHGTTITLHGLNFTEEQVPLDQLVKRIERELPIEPDFRVTVNDEVCRDKKIETAVVSFLVDDSGKHMGHVHGTLYLLKRAQPDYGIRIKVNKRGIGDPRTWASLLNTGKYGTQNKIVGDIHADALTEQILIGREQLKLDDPKMAQLVIFLKKLVKDINNYASGYEVRTRAHRLQDKLGSMLERVADTARIAGVHEITQGTQILLSDDMPANRPGRRVKKENTIYLNSGSPVLRMNPQTTVPQYQIRITQALIDTIAAERVRSVPKMRQFQEFLDQRVALADQVIPPAEKESERKLVDQVHSRILYRSSEFRRLTDLSMIAFNYLTKQGSLPTTQDRVLGKDWLQIEAQIRGFIALPEYLNEVYDAENTRFVMLSKYEEIFTEQRDRLAPFIHALPGSNGTYAFFVDRSCAALLQTELLQSRELDLRVKEGDPSRAFDALQDTYLTIPELAQRLDGMTVKDLANVTKYANKHRIPIARNKSALSLPDVVYANQRRRGVK